MKTIVFANLKGGVGKTSLVFNISSMLATELNKKVLCVDLDLQGNLSNNFKIDRTKQGFLSIKEALEQGIDPKEIKIKVYDNLDVLASSIFLAKTEQKLNNEIARENILKSYFNKNKDFFNQYDYIIIDTNPSFSILNQNALVLCDEIILVSDVSMNSLEGAELFTALYEDLKEKLNLSNRVSGFAINLLDKRIRLSKDFLEYIKEHEDFKNIVFNTYITNSVKIKESELEGKAINLLDRSSKPYEAYQELVKEMDERGIL